MINMNINMHFNVDVAVKIGVDGAIMMNNIHYWLVKNRANKKHYHDNKYWTYNSLDAFVELFPFWSKRQIERILNNLKKDGYIETGNYNKITYDRTKWYTFTEKGWLLMSPNCEISNINISPNGEMEITESGNGNHETVTPIPNQKPNQKPNICTTDKKSVVVDINPNVKLIEEKTHLKAMSFNMKNKVSKWDTDRLIKAIDIFIQKEGVYFSLLEKIYKDDKNYVNQNKTSKNGTDSVKTPNYKTGVRVHETFRDYDPDELEKLLRESQKGKF